MSGWWQRTDYPRSSTYDPEWLLSLDMGPNPLWLLEDLLVDLVIPPGARVLDLGSGLGATSVFLAREFGAEVWATDLWVSEAAATKVIADCGVEDLVHVVNADVRSLSYDNEQFDVMVSIDSWEYFGTDDRVLPSLLRVLRPGGRIGIATPCLREEFATYEECPAHVREVVGWEAAAWHSPDWWRAQWARTGLVDVTSCRAQERGWSDWLAWTQALDARDPGSQRAVLDMLEADGGANLSFAMVTAVKR
ncbi:methyltransferase domain-containing protein [Solicola gregarius]|uniref:Methyltransferase domain-containing protein n=1 Tax=Solicola gregarius TaxID=2908642 RepID=A0AA46YL15_9ACTN|nr:methyltransferase domain-containing protein [Solicola gregarius]UYM06405.1 methyltransferase domain-containing protein [Solicola gregarius]